MNGSDPKGTLPGGRTGDGGRASQTGGTGGHGASRTGLAGTGFVPGGPPSVQHGSHGPVTAAGGTGDLQAGVVLGKYQIVRRLGAGGMGSVYEAVHTHIGKSVALKTMNPALTSDPRAEARFMREAAAASRLGHPNVVDVTDYGSDQGVVYIVMEILRGDDLSTLVQHAPAGLDATFVADVMLAVCAGVFAAHEKGVVHRDLKPQNIFLARTPLGDVVPKVLDFGISKLLDEEVAGGLTNSGSVMGTTHYLSPEQVTGMSVDGRSDEFALGVILYECLTGQRPHHGDTIFTIMRAISEGRFQRPRVLRPDMVPALEAVIMRAMAIRPEDRFPTVHAMGNGLLPFASPRGQVMWGDYFARPPASTVGPSTGVLNPVYAPTPPPGATMMLGPRAFASDTRSGSGVAPVSVIGTNELAMQNGGASRGGRFRGIVLGGLLGAAAVAAVVVLRPGLQLGGGAQPPAVDRAVVEHTGKFPPSHGASSAPTAAVGKPSTPEKAAATPGETPPTVVPAIATPRPAQTPAARAGGTDNVAAAAAKADDRVMDKYQERLAAKREKAETAARAKAMARVNAQMEREAAAATRRAAAQSAALKSPPPTPRPRPVAAPKPAPEDDDMLEGPRAFRKIAPILD
jgi:serine/threonine protein kinase